MTVPDGVAEGLTAAPAAAHRFTALDSLRGIAALGVLLHHLPATNGLAVLPLAGAGSLFVDLFFVLSGFVIAASYGERLADGFSVRRFALLRLGRVVPSSIRSSSASRRARRRMSIRSTGCCWRPRGRRSVKFLRTLLRH